MARRAEICQAGDRLVWAKNSNGSVACRNASKYNIAPNRRRTEKPAAGTPSSVFWRGSMHFWALTRLGALVGRRSGTRRRAKVGFSVCAYPGKFFAERLTESLTLLNRRQDRCLSNWKSRIREGAWLPTYTPWSNGRFAAMAQSFGCLRVAP